MLRHILQSYIYIYIYMRARAYLKFPELHTVVSNLLYSDFKHRRLGRRDRPDG